MPEMYDLAIVPGLQLDSHWRLRRDLKDLLDEAVDLYKRGKVTAILVSGKWTMWFDWLGVKPPVSEAALMRRYLRGKGIPDHAVMIEGRSKDTVGNVYFSRLFVKRHPEFRRLLVICSLQREKRMRFLYSKFFDGSYTVTFHPILVHHFDESSLGDEERLLSEDKELLKDIRNGHEEDLQRRLYAEPYYRRQALLIEKAFTGGRWRNHLPHSH